jgi:hypothetical protein
MSSRGLPVTKQIREERRKRAEEMQKEYDTLTVEQKLAKLPPPPAATKQRNRLVALMNKTSSKPNAEAAEATSSQEDATKPDKPKRTKKTK